MKGGNYIIFILIVIFLGRHIVDKTIFISENYYIETLKEKQIINRRVKTDSNQPENMPLKIVDANLSSFSEVFQKFGDEASQNKANFILFLADKDPSTNLSWCPDCVRAEPVIYKKLEESSDDVALLRAYVGDRPTWRNPQHPWRVDQRFKLKGVPTLIRWEDNTVKGRLEDNEAHLQHKIDALLTAKL